jgi:hypothetical protein
MTTKEEIKAMVKEEFHNEKNLVTISLMTWGQEFERTLDEKLKDLYEKLDTVKGQVAQTTFALKEHDEMKEEIKKMVSLTWFYWVIGAMTSIFIIVVTFLWLEISSVKLTGLETRDVVKEIQWDLKNRFTN